ncbi:MAG: erythrin-vacuolar iron transport family protein [Thermoleophilaceae bacterium]|jgi:VIT1/CCC1 family predicted Fe2+/Mn2+ transporter|nr:erythrin-vacuolar iron transport family protein [Thermoleophilaceae bacterium]
MTSYARSLLHAWRDADERQRVLQVVQPGLLGLTDGTISTLAPIFAAAYVSGSHAALIVGLAAALGAAISMGVAEAISDDGALTGRGGAVARGAITGIGTLLGGVCHTLPFLIDNVHTALPVAYAVVSFELVAIAWVRLRFMRVRLSESLIQVTLSGILVAIVGIALGHG